MESENYTSEQHDEGAQRLKGAEERIKTRERAKVDPKENIRLSFHINPRTEE